MRAWIQLLSGLLVWTAHFFLVYGIASLLPGTVAAKLLVGSATLICLAATGWLLWRALASRRSAPDDLGRWRSQLSAAGSVLALVGIAYQGLPALLI